MERSWLERRWEEEGSKPREERIEEIRKKMIEAERTKNEELYIKLERELAHLEHI